MATKTKEPDRPARKADRVRICGRWQAKGYEPSDAEKSAWKARCKARDWDPRTGKPNVDKTAPASK